MKEGGGMITRNQLYNYIKECNNMYHLNLNILYFDGSIHLFDNGIELTHGSKLQIYNSTRLYIRGVVRGVWIEANSEVKQNDNLHS